MSRYIILASLCLLLVRLSQAQIQQTFNGFHLDGWTRMSSSGHVYSFEFNPKLIMPDSDMFAIFDVHPSKVVNDPTLEVTITDTSANVVVHTYGPKNVCEYMYCPMPNSRASYIVNFWMPSLPSVEKALMEKGSLNVTWKLLSGSDVIFHLDSTVSHPELF